MTNTSANSFILFSAAALTLIGTANAAVAPRQPLFKLVSNDQCTELRLLNGGAENINWASHQLPMYLGLEFEKPGTHWTGGDWKFSPELIPLQFNAPGGSGYIALDLADSQSREFFKASKRYQGFQHTLETVPAHEASQKRAIGQFVILMRPDAKAYYVREIQKVRGGTLSGTGKYKLFDLAVIYVNRDAKFDLGDRDVDLEYGLDKIPPTKCARVSLQEFLKLNTLSSGCYSLSGRKENWVGSKPLCF